MVAKLEPVLKEKFAEIFYDAENKTITATWFGSLKLADVKFGCEEIKRFIRKQQLTKCLSDYTQSKDFSQEVQQYLSGQWFPEVERMGLKKIAILVSDDIFVQAIVNNFNTRGEVGNLKIYTLHSELQCERWLSE